MPRSRLKAIAAAAMFLGVAFPAAAQTANTTAADALRLYLTSHDTMETLFSPRFLERVSLSDLKDSRDKIRSSLGGLCSISPLRGHLLQHLDRGTVHFERGALDVKIVLDAQNRVDELLFLNPIEMNGDLESAVKPITQLPGTASIAVMEGETLIQSHLPDRKAPIPDMKPLSLLTAVQGAVEQGKIQWETVIPWQTAWVDGSSRVLANWPAGHAVTVRSLMDFALQNEGSAINALDDILTKAGAPVPSNTVTMSPVELCGYIQTFEGDGGLSVWNGPAADLGWQAVTYKGGANQTTINHTLLLDNGTRKVCVSATWENLPDGVAALRFWQNVRTVAGVLMKEHAGCAAPNS